MKQNEEGVEIPLKIMKDKKISPGAKILYYELKLINQREVFCCEENRYFSELYGVSTRTIQRWMGSLEKQGYIVIKHHSLDNEYRRDIYIKDV